jgi:hypothetical protein
MVHLPHLGKLRREVKEEALDADDPAAAAGAEASPFHKRSRLAQQQQVCLPVHFLPRSSDDRRNCWLSAGGVKICFLAS